MFIDSQARIYASGKFQGSPDFGNGAVTATAGGGNADGFFAQYSDGGVLGTFVPFNGPTAAHYAYAESAIYSAGSTIVGGSLTGQVNLTGGTSITSVGPLDAFITEFTSPQVVPTWTFQISGTGQESDIRLAQDSAGSIYATGTFTGITTIGGTMLTSQGGTDIFFLRLSPSGSVDWVQSFGGTGDDIATTLAANASGELAIMGDFAATVNFGGGARTSAGGSDIFVATYNGNDGSYRWDHTYGGPMNDFGQSVAIDANGTVYALALFVTSGVDFGTGLLDTGNGTQVLLRYSP